MLSLLLRPTIVSRSGVLATFALPDSQVGYEAQDNLIFEGETEPECVWFWAAYSRDGAPSFYAFRTDVGRDLARTISQVTQGVGPSIASLAVHTHGDQTLLRYLRAQDARAVARGVRGLSDKGAGKVVEALRPRLSDFPATEEDPGQSSLHGAAKMTLEALHGQVVSSVFARALERADPTDVQSIILSYNNLISEGET